MGKDKVVTPKLEVVNVEKVLWEVERKVQPIATELTVLRGVIKGNQEDNLNLLKEVSRRQNCLDDNYRFMQGVLNQVNDRIAMLFSLLGKKD